MRAPALAVLVCFLSAACGEPGFAPPELLGLEPSRAEVGPPVEVVIRGHPFLPRVEANYDDREQSQVDGAFKAWLGEAALEDVTFVSTTELRGRVPAGLLPGGYSLVVEDPSGAVARLENAFVVTGHPAVRLAVTTPERTVAAGECSRRVTLEAQDAAGQPGWLEVPLDVALEVFPAGALSLFSDPECREPLGSARVEPATSRLEVYFSGTTPETVVLAGTSSLGRVEQQARVVPGKLARLGWQVIPAPQSVGTAFEVRAEAFDAFGNRTNDDLQASLSASPDVPLRCLTGCTPAQKAEFRKGVFTGLVAVDVSAPELRLSLEMGNDAYASNAFEVLRHPEGVALAFTTRAQRVAAGRCSAPVTLQLLDAQGQATSANERLGINLGQLPPGLLLLYRDAACTTQLRNAALDPGASRLTFHFLGQREGVAHLAANARNFPPAVQRQEVTAGLGAGEAGPETGNPVGSKTW